MTNILPLHQKMRAPRQEEADELTEHSVWKRRICLLVYASVTLLGVTNSGILELIPTTSTLLLNNNSPLVKGAEPVSEIDDPFTPRIIRETIEVSDIINHKS
mmetsp:Transcript_28377/g.41930  ORF Transcript_28377/g.41930 Transcript_28377/m.41930 type:complete len:102 (+) Transcript_28377:346-651(+)|eukprot:CAMPEP_0194202356 /NCGR_PEP_ID=MMETSP0156-20130528/2403_1 /TAXON_ID=33649 /ORGANISM="Thalassionema nitzschioides, Strain L26-B" /LENGTH=101 /DNA_ID=CAMNT_0038927827 /DNA_START=333 /DNA_END=638 /DNA_ORIENTATION=+